MLNADILMRMGVAFLLIRPPKDSNKLKLKYSMVITMRRAEAEREHGNLRKKEESKLDGGKCP